MHGNLTLLVQAQGFSNRELADTLQRLAEQLRQGSLSGELPNCQYKLVWPQLDGEGKPLRPQ